jgi:chemotaxis protein MotB
MLAFLLIFGGCVTRSSYELSEVQLDATRMALQSRTAACHEDLTARDEQLAFLQHDLAVQRQGNALRDEKISSYELELERYRREHATLHHDQEPTGPTVDEMADGLAALSRIRIVTQQRIDEFQELERHLQPLIADGRLSLSHEQGWLVIRIATDPVFNPEGRLSPYGEDLVTRLAAALADFPPRTWQLDGHTDNVARHSAKYESNWELGFDEAASFLRALRDAGFTAPTGAASYAETEPIADNATDEGRRANRRLELRMIPDLSGRPGNAEIEAIEAAQAPTP